MPQKAFIIKKDKYADEKALVINKNKYADESQQTEYYSSGHNQTFLLVLFCSTVKIKLYL